LSYEGVWGWPGAPTREGDGESTRATPAPPAPPHLVEEDAPKVLAVWEHVRLARQVGAAGVHKVDAGQAAGRGDLLQSQVLLRGGGGGGGVGVWRLYAGW
jgi:hypothetical protein